MEADWKQNRSKLEADWKRTGNKLEAGMKQNGSRLDAEWNIESNPLILVALITVQLAAVT